MPFQTHPHTLTGGARLFRSSLPPVMNMHSFKLFRSSFPDSYHRNVVELVKDLPERADHPPLPGLDIVFDPVVKAAVEEFLGHNVPDQCRHIHWNWGNKDDEFHQDLHDEQLWPVSPKYVMLFYYPQDTPPELGPTEVEDYDGTPHLMSGPAGTCFVMAHDAWHRATANLAMRPRVMIRNLFRQLDLDTPA